MLLKSLLERHAPVWILCHLQADDAQPVVGIALYFGGHQVEIMQSGVVDTVLKVDGSAATCKVLQGN